MLRFKWTPVVTSRAYFFYPVTTQEAPWSSIVLAFVWTTAYLCIPGQLSIGDSMDTVKIRKQVCLGQRIEEMTFWETGVGLWSTAHFVYNSGRSRPSDTRGAVSRPWHKGGGVDWSPKKFFFRPPGPLLQICHCYIQSGPLTIALLQFPKMSFP